MDEKQNINKLNNQKGITTGEVIIALLIIIMTLSVIAMIYTNLVLDSKEIDRKTGATRIATNIIENIDMIYYDEIDTKLQDMTNAGIVVYNGENTYTVVGTANNQIRIFETTIPAGYTLTLTVQNSANYDFLKKISVNISYKLDGKLQNVELDKVVTREIVRECNSPNFEDEYLEQMGVTNDNIVWPYETPETASDDKFIICPIHYNGTSYEIVDSEEEVSQMWYSYSNRQWARVLLLTPNEYIDCMANTSLIKSKLTGSSSYVWIPRFGVGKGGTISENTYFKYRTSNLAILNLYYDNVDYIYNSIDIDETITWSTNYGISFENNELLGKWCKYSDISVTNTDAYLFNSSNYGPLLEY